MQTVTVDGQEALFIPAQQPQHQLFQTPTGQIIRAPAGAVLANPANMLGQTVQLPTGNSAMTSDGNIH